MKAKALKDFYLKAGQRVTAGELVELTDEQFAQLSLRHSVEKVGGSYDTKTVVNTPVINEDAPAIEEVEDLAEEKPKRKAK